MNELNDLVSISKYAGERFDLVQAGGGNSSVKLNDNTMLIKASGFLLSDVELDNGYSTVLTNETAAILGSSELSKLVDKRERETVTASLVTKATIDKVNRPSIETLLHSILMKYTLHTHPVVVNMIVIQKNWRELLNEIFKNDDIALVEYETPGIELATVLRDAINTFSEPPKIIFLQNHGLIVTSDNVDDIRILTEYVVNKIEEFLSIDMSRYKKVSKISNIVNHIEPSNNIAYLSEDLIINELLAANKSLFFVPTFCPDKLVYCGINAVEIIDLDELGEINNYFSQYSELPKIIIFGELIFLISKNIKKAKEIEEVLKFHLMTLAPNYSNVNFLEMDELAYLNNWEAEKFRQNI
tara:strand:+ start:7314 stop:8381 length:1068 start_codon:yes stop_codon:yes gene_type:complete